MRGRAGLARPRGQLRRCPLDGLSVAALSSFEGNIWAGETKADIAFFIDERADERQRDALRTIFSGEAGGWPAQFAVVLGDVRGLEFAAITFEVADDLAHWRVEVPGKASGSAEALSGPTTLPGRRVQVHDPPGAEVGPGTVATQGVSTEDRGDAYGFRWSRAGGFSSKHMPFDWSGDRG